MSHNSISQDWYFEQDMMVNSYADPRWVRRESETKPGLFIWDWQPAKVGLGWSGWWAQCGDTVETGFPTQGAAIDWLRIFMSIPAEEIEAEPTTDEAGLARSVALLVKLASFGLAVALVFAPALMGFVS